MKLLVIVSYILTILIALWINSYFRNKTKAQKGNIKNVYLEWSTKFNLYLFKPRIVVLMLFLYLLWCFYLIITTPDKNNGHYSLMLLLLLLSFYPRWKFCIGSDGILLGTTFLGWGDITNWKITKNKQTKLLLYWHHENTNEHALKKTILVPAKYEDKILKILRENLGTKEQRNE